jgi:hypothetical protein
MTFAGTGNTDERRKSPECSRVSTARSDIIRIEDDYRRE